ncbi:hypothetical protein AVEN_91676-1 [Araneus ventricosus]|uniref:Uncharacterized protein n=1 Tax=Araneus ventricosus TaxID=182803 RepID=A0A4Y2QD12_ARAVE|nr:hypothetical protein AVEN_91676-1 [Araneus ventricosus]
MSEKRKPFGSPLRRGNKKSAGAISGECGRCSRTATLPLARKCITQIAVRTGVVLEQFPLSTLLQLWPNSPDTVQQPLQNSLVGFRIDSCTRGCKFMIDRALTVERGD